MKNLFNKNILICVFTGFSSGLPLFLLFNLLPAWLRSEGIDLKTIGLFALVQMPYTFKFLWSPLLDRFTIFHNLGRRRGWMLLAHLLIFAVIVGLGQFSTKDDLSLIVLLGLSLAFISATLDIVIDAFRREILREDELGLGNGVHISAYRIAGLVPGSLSLILADFLPWSTVFFITALFMAPGLIMVLMVKEPEVISKPKTIQEAIKQPFAEFINRQGWQNVFLILGFIFLYKLGDSLCTALATPFYLDMGYSKTHIGLIAKHAGLWPVVIGGIVGGLLTNRWGLNRALWIFGVVQAVSILGFAYLASIGKQELITSHSLIILAGVIGFEALGVGLGSAAFVSYIASKTHSAYTATQFALFTSLAAVPRTFVNAYAGWFVEMLGWEKFFYICFLLAIPGMLLLFKVAPWQSNKS